MRVGFQQLPLRSTAHPSGLTGHVAHLGRSIRSVAQGSSRCEASFFHGLGAWHHLTGEWSRLSAFCIKELASLKSFTVAPDQYPVLQVAVSQLPPSVIHSSVRN